MSEYLSTGPYKGVRDFYPADAAIEQYIFDSWRATAERFGFERYDASILEPAELYKAKGAENEEIVNEQTYTFTDRGEREVTLRPEMTPTVARMIAGAHRRHELTFPVRWYSIPNLFRYERMQRGRLREHWQLNCDIFGGDAVAADVEIIALAYQLLIDCGATPEMFEIRVNNRAEAREILEQHGIRDSETQRQITRLNDRIDKMSSDDYRAELVKLTENADELIATYRRQHDLTYSVVPADSACGKLVTALGALGIENARVNHTLSRGFDYYTGTIFEIFDTSPENNRALLGGGRYDNLTALFSDDPISGVGFGMGDVTMRDFLETHDLLPAHVRQTAPELVVIPAEPEQNLECHRIACEFRRRGRRVAVDYGTRKLKKKIGDAADRGAGYVLVVGSEELEQGTYTVKNLADGTERSGTLEELTELT